MSNEERTSQEQRAPNPSEWEYPPPPTVYDLVRDNFVLRALRLMLHPMYRTTLHCYNRLSVVGRENLLRNRPCIITPNHSSHLDILAILASLPMSQVNKTCSAAAKDYFFNNAVMAWVARLLANGIPIDRTIADKKGFRLCATKLREGRNLIVFPGGTRTRTGEIGTFRPGAAVLSRALKVPVIPTYIKGTFESLPRSKHLPRHKKITVFFGEPLRFWEGDLAPLEHETAAKYLEDHVRTLKQQTELREDKP